jgi:hypothetical protein
MSASKCAVTGVTTRVLLVSLATLAASCATTRLQKIDEADTYLKRGDLYAAERAYRESRPNQNDPEPWVSAKIEDGLHRIEVERMRQRQPWRKLAGAPADYVPAMLALYDNLRRNGGDAAIEGQLDAAANAYCAAQAAAANKLDGSQAGILDRVAESVRTLLTLPHVSSENVSALQALVAQARDFHLAQASAASPLSTRLHQAMAAKFGGPSLSSSSAADPYRAAVTVTVANPACAASLTLLDALQSSGGIPVAVSVQVRGCRDGSSTIATEETIKWMEQYISHYESRTVTETVCTQTRIPVYLCNAQGTCVSQGSEAGPEACVPVSREVSVPVTAQRERTAKRSATQQQGEFEIAGEYSITIGTEVQRGSFGRVASLSGIDAAAHYDSGVQVVPAKQGVQTFQSFVDGELATVRSAVTKAVRAKQAADLARAMAEASNASNAARADEAWVKVGLLGGVPQGSWATYGIDASAMEAAFATVVTDNGRGATTLRESVVITIPPRPKETASDRNDSTMSQVPSMAKQPWLALSPDWIDVAPISVPDPQHAGQTLITGDTTAGMISARIGTPLINIKKIWNATNGESIGGKFGAYFADEAALELGAGHSVSSPQDVSVGGLARAVLSYQMGVGLRKRYFGGLLAGVRGEASIFTLAASSHGTFANLTPFVRAELALFQRTLAVEYNDYTVLGDRAQRFTLYLSRLKTGDYNRRATSFFWLGYTDRLIHGSFELPIIDPAINNEVSADVGMKSYSAGWGIGF